jgi:hypothetical protein
MEPCRAIAARPDGLGARLCAIFNALLVSELTGCDFAFTWPETYVNRDAFHAVPEVEKVFSADFITRHYFPPSALASMSAQPLKFPDRLSAEEMRHYLQASLRESSLSLSWNQLLRRLEVSPAERKSLVQKVNRRMLFSEELCEIRLRTSKVPLPQRATAMHLRAGDIVYGRFSENPNFAGKTIPAPLANLIIEQDRSGAGFVVFGQEPDFAAKLAASGKATDALQLLPDLNVSPLALALKDVFLMARCAGYYAGSSGFAAFAENIGRCQVVRWDRKRTKPEWSRLILNEVARTGGMYTSQQAGFACFFAYGCLGETDDMGQRTKALAMARAFAPSNRLFGLLYALNAYDQGLWELAEDTLSKLADQLGTNKDALLASREMKRIGLSRTGSGENPYTRHLHGLTNAAKSGCPSAEPLLELMDDKRRTSEALFE